MTPNIKLKHLSIKGWRSIETMDAFYPTDINILIGPNGAGKSNFIGFFDLLSWMLSGKLQERITQLGGASDVLFDGPEVTQQMSGELAVATNTGTNQYKFSLQFAKPDRIYYAEEAYRYQPNEVQNSHDWKYLGGGHTESKLVEEPTKTAAVIRDLLKKMIVYQFHNTSYTAGMRLSWNLDDSRWLKANAQNLGSFLYRVQQQETAFYIRIVKYIKAVLPFFEDFELYPESNKILLRWKERGSIKVFNAGQASDGMLRIIALIAMLAQNPNDLPAVLFLDEPELGLHPAAIDLVAGLIKSASLHCQVIIATQSVSMVNNFSPDDLVVIERKGRGSTYKKYQSKDLIAYLDEFSTSDLWEHNIIGGKP
ncbi:MAG: chromosome segregation protein SMC [Flavobacteriales bacterium]|nr:MAG: chromosome segregation protein SMC [Flavobacteriales bacterium]